MRYRLNFINENSGILVGHEGLAAPDDISPITAAQSRNALIDPLRSGKYAAFRHGRIEAAS
jgi:hypothetical protein